MGLPTGDKVVRNNILFCNTHQIVTATGWAHAADGTITLATNLSSKVFTIPINGLKKDHRIKGFRIVGALGATTGLATVVDADLRKVTKGAGAVTDASVGAITQVSVEADTALDAEKTGLNERVVDDYQYYVKVTGTTANDVACDAAISGVEVDVD
ncbi:hypothetical protein KKD03_05310 [Patescibacteria group bacterium]|nr:hypothetical protein [Patescibacteria group bacterium]